MLSVCIHTKQGVEGECTHVRPFNDTKKTNYQALNASNIGIKRLEIYFIDPFDNNN